mgnify:CR=1 FL=1
MLVYESHGRIAQSACDMHICIYSQYVKESGNRATVLRTRYSATQARTQFHTRSRASAVGTGTSVPAPPCARPTRARAGRRGRPSGPAPRAPCYTESTGRAGSAGGQAASCTLWKQSPAAAVEVSMFGERAADPVAAGLGTKSVAIGMFVGSAAAQSRRARANTDSGSCCSCQFCSPERRVGRGARRRRHGRPRQE